MANPNQDRLIPPANEIESVSEFTHRIKYLLETEIGGTWLRGEVSNLRHQQSGHVYFTLKDERSQVSAVMFRNDAMQQSVDLLDGMQVVVFGQISVYEPRGNYQLIIRLVVEDGLGRLQREFERLKLQLQKEGLFDEEAKHEIPTFPHTVGFITSPTGAAVQDFVRILKRREWRGHVIVLPVKVQGDGAAEEITSMIEYAQKLSGLELLVVGRGGGSLEDLWAFNEEIVVRAIHASEIPVISAVGHEIDFTLSDFVADHRCETPSAAAEIISSHFLELIDRFDTASDNLTYHVQEGIDSRREIQNNFLRRLQLLSPISKIEQGQLRVDDLTNRLGNALQARLLKIRHDLSELKHGLKRFDPLRKLEGYWGEIVALGNRMDYALNTGFLQKRNRFTHNQSLLKSLSPVSILNRGFAIVRDVLGRPLSSKKSIQSGDVVQVEFKDGQVSLRKD